MIHGNEKEILLSVSTIALSKCRELLADIENHISHFEHKKAKQAISNLDKEIVAIRDLLHSMQGGER